MTEKEKKQFKTALAVLSGRYGDSGYSRTVGEYFGWNPYGYWTWENVQEHAEEIVYELILRALGESDS